VHTTQSWQTEFRTLATTIRVWVDLSLPRRRTTLRQISRCGKPHDDICENDPCARAVVDLPMRPGGLKSAAAVHCLHSFPALADLFSTPACYLRCVGKSTAMVIVNCAGVCHLSLFCVGPKLGKGRAVALLLLLFSCLRAPFASHAAVSNILGCACFHRLQPFLPSHVASSSPTSVLVYACAAVELTASCVGACVRFRRYPPPVIITAS